MPTTTAVPVVDIPIAEKFADRISGSQEAESHRRVRLAAISLQARAAAEQLRVLLDGGELTNDGADALRVFAATLQRGLPTNKVAGDTMLQLLVSKVWLGETRTTFDGRCTLYRRAALRLKEIASGEKLPEDKLRKLLSFICKLRRAAE